MFALVDCNSCYAACEQIFRPDLRGQPVIVLSNNDGCIVARNAEAKALGIPDLEPYFKLKPLLKRLGVHVFSSNYPLYGDTSNRVMETLRHYSPEVEVYSIDEMFLQLDGFKLDLNDYGQQMKQSLWQDVRIPVGVGIAPTKTLAKLANHAAKKIPQTNGVCVLDTPKKWQWLQKRMPVNKIWGIGSRLSKRLTEQKIITAADLAAANPKQLGYLFSVNMERTIRELNGESCIPIEEAPPPKKQIYCTRSFGQRINDLGELQQAACLYAARAAEKLRAQNSLAITLHVFINTSHHAADTHFNSKTVKLDYPTSDTRQIETKVKAAIASLYRAGYSYAKAGVGIVELQDRSHKQHDFFTPGQTLKSEALMACMDNINFKFGRNSTHVAAQGITGRWTMNQKMLSPAYTTRWMDIPRVLC
jgi:DNA polymerase V